MLTKEQILKRIEITTKWLNDFKGALEKLNSKPEEEKDTARHRLYLNANTSMIKDLENQLKELQTELNNLQPC